jgi:hypothetical protein
LLGFGVHAFDFNALHQSGNDSVGCLERRFSLLRERFGQAAVTILALRRLASRTRHICQASIPIRAVERQRKKAIVELSQEERKKAGIPIKRDRSATCVFMIRRRCGNILNVELMRRDEVLTSRL